MEFPSKYFVDAVLKQMYNIKNGINESDLKTIDKAKKWLIEHKNDFIDYYSMTDNVNQTIALVIDESLNDVADSKMTLDEATQILIDSGYVLEEGIFSDIKNKIVSKVKDISAYNEWCKDVIKLLKNKYRITIDELKRVLTLDNTVFKKCYNQCIKPINFVRALMNKYAELMRKEWDNENDIYDFYCSTPTPAVAEATKVIEHEMMLIEACEVIEAHGYTIISEGKLAKFLAGTALALGLITNAQAKEFNAHATSSYTSKTANTTSLTKQMQKDYNVKSDIQMTDQMIWNIADQVYDNISNEMHSKKKLDAEDMVTLDSWKNAVEFFKVLNKQDKALANMFSRRIHTALRSEFGSVPTIQQYAAI